VVFYREVRNAYFCFLNSANYRDVNSAIKIADYVEFINCEAEF